MIWTDTGSVNLDLIYRRFGGVATSRQLYSLGYTPKQIRQASAAGQLTPLRHGFHAFPDADPRVISAVADHSVVTCVTALTWHQLWIPEHDKRVHARVTRHERRQSHDRCRRHGRPTPARGSIDDVATALQYYARCFSEEEFIIVCDSALHHGKLSHDELRREFLGAPEKLRAAIERCDRRAASGTETATRLRLRSMGVHVEVQHHVPEVGWVDLLIGGRLVLELDSRDHHTGESNYESDRTRDRKLVAQGYLPMRVTYGQVFRTWDSTYRDIQSVIARGQHRRKPG